MVKFVTWNLSSTPAQATLGTTSPTPMSLISYSSCVFFRDNTAEPLEASDTNT